jgi:predicted TIM-barrel fold metal-dependent hydrolase
MTFSETARQRLEKQVEYLSSNRGTLVIDADTHATDTANMHPEFRKALDTTPDYYHGRPVSAEELIAEMDMAGVDMGLIWQNPAATLYGTNQQANFESLLAANRYIFDSAMKYPERFIPAGWTDPKSLGIDLAIKLTETCIFEFGFPIVKMNPAQNAFPITDERVTEVVDYIVEAGATPAFHFGADTEYTPAEGLAAIAKRHPGHPVLGVHMGGGGAGYPEAEDLYQRARQMGLEHPNVKFVMSAKRDTHIESDLITFTLAGEPFCSNIFCGSDAPYGRMTWNFGGYRAMFNSLINGKNHTDVRVRNHPGLFSEEIAQKYLGSNFAGFIIEISQLLLQKSSSFVIN